MPYADLNSAMKRPLTDNKLSFQFLQGYHVEERFDLFYEAQEAECVKTIKAGGDSS